jgi:hypothetical protein
VNCPGIDQRRVCTKAVQLPADSDYFERIGARL